MDIFYGIPTHREVSGINLLSKTFKNTNMLDTVINISASFEFGSKHLKISDILIRFSERCLP